MEELVELESKTMAPIRVAVTAMYNEGESFMVERTT